MSIRRYDDDEVREIFSLATTTGAIGAKRLPRESRGLTLSELTQIAGEAGIDAASVLVAAQTLDARGTAAPVRRLLGLPIGLSRVVDLPRAPNDREWAQLVAECRTILGAPGHATTSEGLREWSHGDVHVCVEPTERGERLRFTATNSDATGLNVLALILGSMSLLMTAGAASAGKLEKALPLLVVLGGSSVVTFGLNLIRLPRWAREREGQMDAIAGHALQLLSEGEPPPSAVSGRAPEEHDP